VYQYNDNSTRLTCPVSSDSRPGRLEGRIQCESIAACRSVYGKPSHGPKERELDEHRKISETVMQQLILKIGSVDTEGQGEA
jgi:hypothetical protein